MVNFAACSKRGLLVNLSQVNTIEVVVNISDNLITILRVIMINKESFSLCINDAFSLLKEMRYDEISIKYLLLDRVKQFAVLEDN